MGKKFEAETVLKAFKNRSSQWYGSLKSKVSADFGKNLDDYDMFSQVELKYAGDDYFVADQIFVRYKTNALGQKTIDDIIIIENKLKSSTQLTTPQTRALSKNSYTVRNAVDKVSEFGSSNTLKQNNVLNFNGGIKWYKVYDSDNGDVITGIDKL